MPQIDSDPHHGGPYEGPLEITDVRIRYHARPGESDILKAFATITLNGVFVIHDLKVIEKPERLFVSMPACQSKTGRYRDIAHPISRSFRDYMEEAVISAYHRGDEDPSGDGHGSAEMTEASENR